MSLAFVVPAFLCSDLTNGDKLSIHISQQHFCWSTISLLIGQGFVNSLYSVGKYASAESIMTLCNSFVSITLGVTRVEF